MKDKLLPPQPAPPRRALPPLPAAPKRALRPYTPRTSQKSSASHVPRPLSPVSEVPHPSEIQTMQLEVDILNQELATERYKNGEMERQVASLKQEIRQYQLQISRQNHLVAQIAHTIKFYSSDYRFPSERSQHTKTDLPEMEQVPRQDSGWM
ncbi:hypothetical protein C7999DRAFT_18530 [Corynascus novoguineensis]|uniref:Uncharacterized protein n=1 Tax=Corynascus novoguineensis TaxID=1126955 RepID=A0AAN7CKP5_9PEZI|nr:hypothetical protein C7999DRAFT_18530 [Corynascus novoguineensis]